MKKILALALGVAMLACLAVPVLAMTPEEAANAPIIMDLPEPTYQGDPNDPYGIMLLSGNPGMEIVLPDSFPQPDVDPNDPYGIMLLNGAPAEEVDVPVARSFVGDVTVNGEAVNLLGIPGAPNGYVPMRAICEAMGAYVDWIAEECTALFLVNDHSVEVNLTDLSVKYDFEPVENVKAYLDPNGYTFLPASFLATIPHIAIDDHPEMDSIHYDIATNVYSVEETVALAIWEMAEGGAMIQLDKGMLVDNYGFNMDNYESLTAFQPMMSAQPTTVVIANVKEGQMEAAKADFAAYHEAIKATLGFYPATAEAVEKAQTVEAADGHHLMLVATWESNDQAVAMFQEAFPAQ